MNEDIIEGKWKQLKGRVQEQWGRLTEDDIDRVDGRQDRLEGILQERYGIGREEAREQIEKFASKV